MNTNLYISQIVRKFFVCEVAAPPAMSDALKLEISKVAEKMTVSCNPMTLRTLNGRLERGLEIALSGSVLPIPGKLHVCRVVSSDHTHFYLVDVDARTCECPDSLKGNHCKHRIAAYYFTQATANLAKAAPVENQQKQIQPATTTAAPRKTEAQILKELGFDDDAPRKVAETPCTQDGTRLGSLYRKYLHGLDLEQKPVKVTIANITKETVTPRPGQPSFDKYCIWVTGLPAGTPNGILFGAQGEKELVAIFGRVSLESIKGKSMTIYPVSLTVAGQPRIAIHFKSC